MRGQILAALILLPATAFAGDAEHAAWFSCHDNSDCVVARGVCGKAAVNKTHVQEFERWAAEIAKRAECAPDTDRSQFEPACIKGSCAAKGT